MSNKKQPKRISGWAWTSLILAVIATATTIGWLNSYPPMGHDVTALATAISAFATVLLAVFAYRAWISSKEQLKHMKQDSKEQISLLREESDASEQRSIRAMLANDNLESRRTLDAALFGYLSAHADLFAASARTLTELQFAQVELRKSSIRFIMVNEFKGRSGEINNFDDLMMIMAEARVQARFEDSNGVVERELAYGLNQGFNMLNNRLRDFYQERIQAPELHEAFESEFSELAHTYRLELPKKYIDLVRSRGWIE